MNMGKNIVRAVMDFHIRQKGGELLPAPRGPFIATDSHRMDADNTQPERK